MWLIENKKNIYKWYQLKFYRTQKTKLKIEGIKGIRP